MFFANSATRDALPIQIKLEVIHWRKVVQRPQWLVISKNAQHIKKKKPSTQKSIGNFSGPNAKKSGEDLLTKTVNFFISGNIAFNQADNPHFHDMIRTAAALGPAKLPTINRKNTRQRLTDLALNGKEDLLHCLMGNESKISLALDCWTSKNNYAFLGKSPLIPTSFLYQADHSYYCSLD